MRPALQIVIAIACSRRGRAKPTSHTRAPLDVRRSRVGALGEATSSKDQVMTYPSTEHTVRYCTPRYGHFLDTEGKGTEGPRILKVKVDKGTAHLNY